MIYFNSRHLAEKLEINLAKWKRWVREFLPPDPLGGLQSGYARQFNFKDAFRVYLGGRLVSTLRFSIPETRQILSDLDSPLENNGFYELYPSQRNPGVEDRWLYIYSRADGTFEYAMPKSRSFMPKHNARYGRVLLISDIYMDFLKRISAAPASNKMTID